MTSNNCHVQLADIFINLIKCDKHKGVCDFFQRLSLFFNNYCFSVVATFSHFVVLIKPPLVVLCWVYC